MLGYSLIIAIVPQNVLLIKQGVRREGITAVILVRALSAIVLVAAGTASVGILIEKTPFALEILSWGGAAYLLWFAIRTLRDAIDPKSLHDPNESEAEAEAAGPHSHDGKPAWFKPMLMAFSLTCLNPATYVDFVVMLGGIANQYSPDDRWRFTLGASIAAATLFSLLGYDARALSEPLSRPKMWRWLNAAISGMLLSIVARLVWT